MLACSACAVLSSYFVAPSFFAASASAQTPERVNNGGHVDTSVWEGEWQAENTLFSLRVMTQGNRFVIEPVSSLGLEWNSSDGRIDGHSGTINVEYQGVSAQVLVQLISNSSAIVRSMSCQPDYHVVCTLVRNQQALFIKVQSPLPSPDL